MSRSTLTFAALICVMLGASQLHAELTINGNFENAGPNGLDTQHTGQAPNQNESSQSAADGWFVWHNVNGSTETNSMTYDEAGLPTIFPTQDRFTDRLLRVEASNAGNGLVQTFTTPGSGPSMAAGSVWIYVGGPGQKAGVGIGDGGSTIINDETSGVGGRWEQISFSQSTSPVNEIVIYATTSGAEFYVDMASVHAVPEPASAALLSAIGIGSIGLRRRRTRSA